MLIEILYVPGCPNHEPSLGRIREALQSQSVAVPIHEIEVTDEAMVRVLHFPGSPTIRVNGKDVEPSGGSSIGLSCRLYSNGSGVPSQVTLEQAISNAKEEEKT
jgi:hypothetical protein